MTGIRVLIAVIFIPLFIIFVRYTSSEIFLLLILIGVISGEIEFYRLVKYTGQDSFPVLGIILGIVLSCSFIIDSNYVTYLALSFCTIIILIYCLKEWKEPTKVPARFSSTLMGVLYISFLLSHMIWLRKLPAGYNYIFLLVLITWMCDTGAYFIGTYMGRIKLWPLISPRKTVEGSIGGLLFSIIGGIIAKIWFFETLSYYQCIIIGISMGITGQVGDLCESILKRGAKIKDSGVIIPGHGGMLDKMDSLLFNAPFLYYYSRLFVL